MWKSDKYIFITWEDIAARNFSFSCPNLGQNSLPWQQSEDIFHFFFIFENSAFVPYNLWYLKPLRLSILKKCLSRGHTTLKSPPCELHKLNPYLTKVTHSYTPKSKKKRNSAILEWRHNNRTKFWKKILYFKRTICAKKACKISDPQVVYFFYNHSLRNGGQKCVFSSRHIGNLSLVAKGLKAQTQLNKPTTKLYYKLSVRNVLIKSDTNSM